MSEASKAVFLSYASQDAEAARKICESLRADGVEVWFDADGGLEHGDAWDTKIRRQIKECVLFIPLISANTQARHEGYFRLEWDLAAERARTIASGVPFILPIIVDATREPDALVPDRFRTVQWTRLPLRQAQGGPVGEVTPEVRARFLKLWSHRVGVVAHAELETGRPVGSVALAKEARPAQRDSAFAKASADKDGVASPALAATRGGRRKLAWLAAALVVLGAGGYFGYRTYVARRTVEIRAVLGQTEPVKKESRVLVARFENRSGEPALDLTGQLIADHIRRYLPELEWVREAVTLPATEKVSADLTADDMSRLARKTGADALIAGAYHRQGDKVVLRGRVFDLTRGKTWADLAPIEGPVADASTAVEELAERLLGIASDLGEDRRGERNVAVMNNFSVPQRWDSRRILSGLAGLSPEQRDARQRRSYELDPKGAAHALVSIAVSRAVFARRDYAGADVMLLEIDALPLERLTPWDREQVAWVRAVTGGDLGTMLAAAQRLHAWAPNDRRWSMEVLYGLAMTSRPKAMLAEFAGVAPGSPLEKDHGMWSWRPAPYFALGDDAAMLAAAQRFRELWPDHQMPLQFCIWAHVRLGDYAAATRLLDDSSGLRPQGREGYPGFHFLVALTQMRRLGRAGTPEFAALVQKAEAWFASRPPQEAASEAQRFDRARVRYLAGRYAEARLEGETLVREFPDNRAYRGFVGSCAARRGDTEGAQAALTWLRAVDPKYRFGHHVYLQAQITALLGQRDDALRLLREAKAQFAAPVDGVSLVADHILLHPDLESLADDPELKALVAPKG